jgi:hypothetical protein
MYRREKECGGKIGGSEVVKCPGIRTRDVTADRIEAYSFDGRGVSGRYARG